MLARLQLLSKLVPILGVQPGIGEGVPLEGLMKFLGYSFASANAETRSAAVNLTVLVLLPSNRLNNACMPASLKNWLTSLMNEHDCSQLWFPQYIIL